MRGLTSLPRTPWIIPDMNSLNNIAPLSSSTFEDLRQATTPLWKYRISAASVAIQYMFSQIVGVRSQVRKFLVHQDQTASPIPRDHAQGVIWLAKENPKPRNERRVSLWKSVRAGNISRLVSTDLSFGVPTLSSSTITRYLGYWMAEALYLTTAGIPRDSFILTFDGEDYPKRCSEILQEVVHRHAAWQQAAILSLSRASFVSQYHIRPLSKPPTWIP